MTKKINFNIGPRDIELLTALDRSPMTARQLCRLSETFAAPFADEDNLRRRMRTLADAELVNKFPYAIACDGRSPSYYKLTQQGYRMLYGVDATLPKRRYFQPVSTGHHHHTFCLAETIVHLCVTAKQNDAEVLHFSRENSVKLEADPFVLFPDCAFVIRRADGKTFPFVVELDNGTERVRSKQDTESIERKLRGYDAHQSRFDAHDPERYLVLFITTRSEIRLRNILDTAANIMIQPQRTVFIGVEFQRFLAADPFVVPLFEDNRNLRRAMIPLSPSNAENQRQETPVFVRSVMAPVL